MSDVRVLRALVTQRLSAAAEQIVDVVQRTMLLQTAETSPEQQSAVVQKRLSLAADEIFKILENLMGEYEAEVSKHQCKLLDITLKTETNAHRKDRLLQQKCEHSQIPSPLEKMVAQPQFKDASTETGPELFHGKPSYLHQTQCTERSTVTVMETETQGDQCAVPSSDQEILSSKNPETESECTHVTSPKLNKIRTCRKIRQSQGADCSIMCGRSFYRDAAGNKMKIESRKTAPTNKSRTTGQSCCRVCGKCFWYKRSFLKHVLKHEQSTDMCGVCGKQVDSVESLKVHLQAHNEENSCRDQTDDKESSTECSDAENNVTDSDEDWKESEGTDSDKDENNRGSQKTKSETKIQALNITKIAKSEDCKELSHLKYCCKVCGKSFCYRASFLKHVQEDERDTDVCGVCGKRFETEGNLRLHLQTYIRTKDCEVCGKHFDGLKQLEMHMRTHTGEKPYVCSTCGKAFAQNGNLMGHMRVHTGEKPYVCSVCGQSFSFKEYMMAHMRIHTGEKPFLCSVCGKGFRQRGTLKTHMMIHTGESTHRCVVCDKTFYKSGALKIHMRSHTGEKPYLCNVCGKSFTAGSSLNKHMDVHGGERTHCCSICAKGFPRKEDLKKHVQTHGSL